MQSNHVIWLTFFLFFFINCHCQFWLYFFHIFVFGKLITKFKTAKTLQTNVEMFCIKCNLIELFVRHINYLYLKRLIIRQLDS